MVDQVLADAGQVDDGSAMPCAAQLLGRADAGQHQQLRRHQRAGGDDHLAVGEGPPLAPRGIAIGDADGAPVLDLDPAHRRVEAERQVGIARRAGR